MRMRGVGVGATRRANDQRLRPARTTTFANSRLSSAEFWSDGFTMIVSHPTVHNGKLTYVSPKPGLGEAFFGIFIAVGLVFVLGNGVTGTFATPGGTAGSVIVLVFFAILFLLA